MRSSKRLDDPVGNNREWVLGGRREGCQMQIKNATLKKCLLPDKVDSVVDVL
jgi:hypothetical protein